MHQSRAQPFQVTGRDGADLRAHVPDVLLVHTDQTVTVVDVKPAAVLEKPAVRAQFDWTRALCRDKGWQYEVFSGGDPTVLRNIKFLAIGRHPERLPAGRLDAARASLGAGEATLDEVLARKPVTCEESLASGRRRARVVRRGHGRSPLASDCGDDPAHHPRGAGMSVESLDTSVGARLWYEGAPWTVVELDGPSVVLRGGDRFKKIHAPSLVGHAESLDQPAAQDARAELDAVVLAALSSR